MKKRVLSLLLVLLMVVTLVPTAALADSDTVKYAVEGGNIYFDKATGTITDCDSSVTEAVIPEEIEGVEVEGIAIEAFSYCRNLTSVEIPNSVTSIGHSAFADCTALTSITIPDSVTGISTGAFRGCTSLTSIEISNSVTSIGSSVFYGCTSLTSINVAEDNVYYSSDGGVLFNKEKTTLISYPLSKTNTSYEVPNSVTSIEACAFSDCTGLTSVTIPNSVMSVGPNAFKGCTSLMSIEIPNSVSDIEWGAFLGCTSLTSIEISNGVKSIGSSAFQDCTGLTSVTIPNSVTSIYSSAFEGCTGLTSVTIPNSVTSIGSWAFDGCTSLTDVYYSGNETEWNAIGIEPGNECLTKATIYYGKEDTHTHNFVAEVTEPTCTENGYTTYTCSCGETYTSDIVPAKGHSPVLVSAKDATCTEDGYTGDNICSVCKMVLSKGLKIEHFGHDYVNGKCNNCGAIETEQGHVHNYSIIKVTEPTCTEQGYTTYTCSVCGKSYVSNYVSAMDHYYVDGTCTRCGAEDPNYVQHTHVYNEHTEYPTCTKPGYTEHWCNICGKYYFDAVTDALGHNYVNGTCIICGTSGTANVTESGFCGIGSETNVYWTLYEDGTIVVSGSGDVGIIDCDKSKIKKVIVEEGVNSINYAFQNCTNLKSAYVSITVIPGTISIMDYAFYGCTNLTDVTISEGMTRINYHAFEGCTSLENITLPSTIDSVDEWSFAGCTALESITIPENATLIMWNAFENCTSLKSVDIKSCITIDSDVFAGCTSLESVNLPENIQYIGYGAFGDCSSLKNVHYAGTDKQWDRVNIADDNDPLLNATTKHVCSFSNPVVTEPTCTEDGYTTYTCSCGEEIRSFIVPALGHDYKNGVCSRCGEREAHTHDFVETVTAPTCTEQGYTTYTCSCGETYTKNYVSALGHKTELCNAVEPTCTEAGYTGDEVCSVCGETISQGETIDATGHHFKGKTCTDCGATRSSGDVIRGWFQDVKSFFDKIFGRN